MNQEHTHYTKKQLSFVDMIVPAIIFVKELVELEEEKQERLDLEVR